MKIRKISLILGLGTLMVFAVGPSRLQACTSTPHGCIPDFSSNPSIQNITNGNWSDATTWAPQRVPSSGDRVLINSNTQVIYDALSADSMDTVSVKGELTFKNNINTLLRVVTLYVPSGGTLTIGTAASPIGASVKAEIVIRNQSINSGSDPEAFGTGLIGMGTIRMHGAVKSPTFVRLSQELNTGNSLQFAQSVSGWRAGDKIVLPDTRAIPDSGILNYTSQTEERTLGSVGGNLATLTQSVANAHKGARHPDQTLQYLPHVGNITRNVIIRSENPNGTRGHVFLTGSANVDIRYVQFQELGRTTYHPTDPNSNRDERFPVHLASVYNPGPILIGNAVVGMAANQSHDYKFGVAFTNSHSGEFRDNMVYNVAGSGLALLSGSESFNTIDHNFFVRIMGNGLKDITNNINKQKGSVGAGIWSASANNNVLNNVVAAAHFTHITNKGHLWNGGYIFYPVKNTSIPSGKGSTSFVPVNMWSVPMRQFDNNEAYGASSIGFGTVRLGQDTTLSDPSSVIDNLKVWHPSKYAYRADWTSHVRLQNVEAYQDSAVREGRGLKWETNVSKKVIVDGARIYGFDVGIHAVPGPETKGSGKLGTMEVRGGELINTTGILIEPQAQYNTGNNTTPRQIDIWDVHFGQAANLNPQYDIEMNLRQYSYANLVMPNQVFLHNYKGADYKLYYLEQRGNFIVPQSNLDQYGNGLIGSPDAGQTNTWNMANHGIAIAGEIAPCAQQDCSDVTPTPKIKGYLFSSNSQLPQITLHPTDKTAAVGQSVTFSVAATGTNLKYQWQRNNGDINGETAQDFTITSVTANDDGARFKCIVTGTVSSREAVLTVTQPQFILTVNKGTGDGSFAAGATVPIAPDPSPQGQVFDKWTGDIQHLSNPDPKIPNTTITMPAANVTVAATYKAAPVTTFQLIVNFGSGSGDFSQNSIVQIVANPPNAGKVFDQWSGAPSSSFGNVNSPNTTFVMPGNDVTLMATYKDAPSTLIQLTVINGSGSGTYPAGSIQLIQADPAPPGTVFDRWIGNIASLDDSTSHFSLVTIPGTDMQVTAVFRAFQGSSNGGGPWFQNRFGAGEKLIVTQADLGHPGHIRIKIYDQLGRIVKTDSSQGDINLDLGDFPSGLYTLRIEGSGSNEIFKNKFVIIK